MTYKMKPRDMTNEHLENDLGYYGFLDYQDQVEGRKKDGRVYRVFLMERVRECNKWLETLSDKEWEDVHNDS